MSKLKFRQNAQIYTSLLLLISPGFILSQGSGDKYSICLSMRTVDALLSLSSFSPVALSLSLIRALSLSLGGVLLSQRKRAAVSAGGFIRRGMQMSRTVTNPSLVKGEKEGDL